MSIIKGSSFVAKCNVCRKWFGNNEHDRCTVFGNKKSLINSLHKANWNIDYFDNVICYECSKRVEEEV